MCDKMWYPAKVFILIDVKKNMRNLFRSNHFPSGMVKTIIH